MLCWLAFTLGLLLLLLCTLQGLGGVLRYGILPAPDLAFVAKYPMSGNWPHNGYNKEVGETGANQHMHNKQPAAESSAALLRGLLDR